MPHHCTTSVRMSVIVNYLKSRMEILILNARAGMAIDSQQYEELSKSAVNAIKQVCLGVKGVSPQELTELLQAITDAPLNAQYRCELRDLFNQMLSNDPSLSSTELVKVHFPEKYLRTEDWNQLMDSGKDVSTKLLYLATLWANLGLVHPSEKSSKNIAALGVLTEPEVVIAGPLGVQRVRTFKKFLKDTAANVRADISSKSPEVYTGFVDQLQQHFPVWYNMVYSEGHPPVACPAHLLNTVRRMQACMGCRCSKAGCENMGSIRGSSTPMGHALQMLMNMPRNSQTQVEQPLPGLVVYPKDHGLPGPSWL